MFVLFHFIYLCAKGVFRCSAAKNMKASCLSVVLLVVVVLCAASLCSARKISVPEKTNLVRGRFFDRIWIIVLENQPFDKWAFLFLLMAVVLGGIHYSPILY